MIKMTMEIMTTMTMIKDNKKMTMMMLKIHRRYNARRLITAQGIIRNTS